MQPSTRQYISSSPYGRFGGYLENQHFFGTLLLAFLLHLGGITLYQILPKEVVELVPVRVLNIKIGQPVTQLAEPKRQSAAPQSQDNSAKNTRDMRVPVTAKKPAPKPAIKKPATPSKPQPAKKSPVIKPVVKPVAKAQPRPQKNTAIARNKPSLPEISKGISIAEAALAQRALEESHQKENHTAKQYVREDAIPADRYQPTPRDENGKAGQGSGEGSAIGNSNLADAEVESRYTQTLSLWLNRYKVYPVEARSAGTGGTVMLRIRINRQGRIMRYYLERSSGHKILDNAISAMVNAANPVPAVPPNYPDPRPYLEFLVPIHFKP